MTRPSPATSGTDISDIEIARSAIKEVLRYTDNAIPRDGLKRALSALARLSQPAGAWQGMESAPDNGRDILVAFKGQFDWVMFVAQAFGAETMLPGYAQPTHWQLPPPPPAEEATP